MKTFIAQAVQVLLSARKPDSRSDRGYNRTVSAFRFALFILLALGLLGGISQAQEPLVIGPTGDVSIGKTLSVGGKVTAAKLDLGNGVVLNGTEDWNWFKDKGKKDGSGLRVGSAWGMYGIYASLGRGVVGGVDGVNLQNGKVVVNTDGNVGIGKEPTADKLSVVGNANFSGNVGIGTEPTANKLAVGGNSYFSGSVVIGTEGNVVIGTEPKPQEKLSEKLRVHGHVIVFGDVIAKGKFWTQDNKALGEWRYLGSRSTEGGSVPPVYPSDLRLKSQLRPIRSALESIRRLNGVTYKWNDEALKYFTRDIETAFMAGPNATAEENQEVWQRERDKQYKELSNTQVGVIAQDVEAVLPQAVTTDASGYKSVNYSELIPLVIEALKEEDRISQEQARTIASQQTEIQRLTFANNAAQQQSSELQEIKQKLGYLETKVNKLLAAGLPGDKDKLASAVERSAGDHLSRSE